VKRLNEQVRRNADRFPGDFIFQPIDVLERQFQSDCVQPHADEESQD
jgi:hypothetical protein